MLRRFISIVLCTTISVSSAIGQEISKEQEAAIVEAFNLTMEGQSHYYVGRLVEAEEVFRRVLDIHANGITDSPLSVASALHKFAAAVARQGRLP